jgi:hypothetical protein
MYILLAISVLCFFALVLAAVAMARHVRSRQVPTGQHDFAQRVFVRVIAKTNLHHAFEPTLADTRNQSISSKRF